MTNEVHTLAKIGVQFLNLREPQQLEKCIGAYSMKYGKGLEAKIQYLFFCLVEQLKHLFRESSWEQSLRSLEEKERELCPLAVMLLPSAVRKVNTTALNTLIWANQFQLDLKLGPLPWTIDSLCC